jgi:hypothetical protein
LRREVDLHAASVPQGYDKARRFGGRIDGDPPAMSRLRGGPVLFAVGAALLVRVVRSRHRRFLHPAGRSFVAELQVPGTAAPCGAELFDKPGRHRATVRLSKGVGTRGARPDLQGFSVRVHLPGRRLDLLLSTAGQGRLSRHVPVPRRGFDVAYGSIAPYRTATAKVYVAAVPDPAGPPLGRTLEGLAVGGRLLLQLWGPDGRRTVGRVSLRRALPSAEDAALAFDPTGNVLPDLHPTGLVHGIRGAAYRLSQRWRGARPGN